MSSLMLSHQKTKQWESKKEDGRTALPETRRRQRGFNQRQNPCLSLVQLSFVRYFIVESI
jgi:hypothetical protein